MMDISERSFEDAIEQGPLQHGPDAAAAEGMGRETPPGRASCHDANTAPATVGCLGISARQSRVAR